MIAFTGVSKLKSCVRTYCFQLFDICRVEFIWGNITFLSYIDGLVQERSNSGVVAMELRFLALTHRSIHHGTRSRVYHTLTTFGDLVPQGANASADILNTTFSLIFFSASVLAISHCSWLLFFVHIVYFPRHDKKYDAKLLSCMLRRNRSSTAECWRRSCVKPLVKRYPSGSRRVKSGCTCLFRQTKEGWQAAETAEVQ